MANQDGKLGEAECLHRTISEVIKAEGSYMGIIPLVPNGIAIDTTQGQEHRLSLGKRGTWIDAINTQSQQHQ